MSTTVTGAMTSSHPAVTEEPVTAEIVEDSVSTDRTMFDSNTVNSVPLTPTPEMVCWYPFTWGVTNKAQNTIARFSDKTQILTIDNVGNEPGCDILDVETGAATFADATSWVTEKKKLGGHVPTIYCSADNLNSVADAVSGLGFVWIWVAEWTGVAHEYAGAMPGENMHLCATQYASPSTPGSVVDGNYDLSLVSNADWHPAPAPATTDPAPVSMSGVVAYVQDSRLVWSAASSTDGKTWTTG